MRGLLRHEIGRNCDPVDGMQPTTRRKRAITFAEIYSRHIDVAAPGVTVLVGVDKKSRLAFTLRH